MFKKIILICMGLVCLYMFFTTIIKAYKEISRDTVIENQCDGKIIMTCGEGGCENICYPIADMIHCNKDLECDRK